MNESLAKVAPVAAIEMAPLTAPQAPPPAAQPATQLTDIVSADTLERLKYVAPEYPLAAQAQGTSGWVDLAFDVQTNGAVDNVAVLASEPKNTFERAAVAALRKWRFQPVERAGHAVVQRARLRIRFTVK
jgi:TonB family protein